MTATFKFMAAFLAVAAVCAPVWAQESPAAADGQTDPAADAASIDSPAPVDDATAADDATVVVDSAASDEPAGADVTATAEEPADANESDSPAAAVTGAVDEVAEDVDRNPEAQRVKAGVLQPIYALAERFSFPWFHWIAFAVMVAGVVSFALQLVLGKLVVLAKGSISFSEILSDGLGLIVSLVGLVLTTQAAAENSTFTTSAFQVLSATAAGGLAGFIFYLWGQRQEVQAAAGRRAAAATRDVLPPRK